MANAVLLSDEAPYPAPRRLVGALAAAATIGNNASKKERIRITGLGVVRVRAKASAVTGTMTLQIHPMLSDATKDDTVGTRATTNLPTAATATGATEITQDFTSGGEMFIEVVLSMSNGGSDTCTLSYVEVYAIP